MFPSKKLCFEMGCVLLAVLAAGCNSGAGGSAQADQQRREIARLEQENQALAGARTGNQEVRRLKQENQDLPKLRSQYQEMTRLQRENDQLSNQIARLQPRGDGTEAAALAPGQTAGQAATAQLVLDQKQENEKDTLHEGDEILIEPKYLQQLLPDFDWEKLGRKEPLAVRSILERDGTILTNIAQLTEMGLTNFVIQRAPVASVSPDQAGPQN